MHLIVDHCCKMVGREIELELVGVGLEAGSLKPLATFLLGYWQSTGCGCSCCVWCSSSEANLLRDEGSRCCISPYSYICFCCFSKPSLRGDKLCIKSHRPKAGAVTSLSLAGNELGKKPQAIKLICEVLKGETTLARLDLSNNGIGPVHCKSIAGGLQHRYGGTDTVSH